MASQHQRQIQQMKAFILQEAAEKRNEINIKVGKEGAPSRRALHSPASLLTRPPPPPCAEAKELYTSAKRNNNRSTIEKERSTPD